MAENTSQGLSKEEIGYLRRKKAAEKIFPFFRFIILFGLGFVILYPLIYMISCTFRERGDMNDPTVMWIPRNFTLNVLKETLDAMDFPNTLITTLMLNVGCAFVQVISCAVTGYGFARFKFRGQKLLFGIVIMMILVPPQVIALPLYSQFRSFGIGSLSVNLIDTAFTMYLPAITANGIRAGLMILIFRQFFKGLPRELEDAAYIDGCGPFRTFLQVM
ncbi:MAG: carbohydrate ABC transporter permease, partial [Ruminococcus sp.]|nr:carbohydrate ABC transporter permease [Ruminococcus sp.]